MAWLGLDSDEGPYYQSDRYQRYEQVAMQLLALQAGVIPISSADRRRGDVGMYQYAAFGRSESRQYVRKWPARDGKWLCGERKFGGGRFQQRGQRGAQSGFDCRVSRTNRQL